MRLAIAREKNERLFPIWVNFFQDFTISEPVKHCEDVLFTRHPNLSLFSRITTDHYFEERLHEIAFTLFFLLLLLLFIIIVIIHKNARFIIISSP